MEDGLIKKLMATIKCGSCKQSYKAHNIEVLGRNENLWFLRVVCSSCHTQCLVAAIIREEKALEVVSDLSEAERAKLATAAAVDGNDLLDMHEFLKHFDGNISHILGPG